MKSTTGKLAEFIAGVTFADLPKEVVYEAKRDILDVIGCAMGGYMSEIGRITINFMRELGGKPEATLIGAGDKTSCINAAYANSRMANALDYDDTFWAVGHFANAALGASLAICEREGASGKDLITSFTVGFEVAARFGLALGPSSVEEGGLKRFARYFSHSAPMVIAAVAAAAKALRLSADQVYHALGIAGANMPIPVARKWGETAKPLPLFKYGDSGWCAQTGVAAALLAWHGTTGLDDIFEGDGGVASALGVPAGQYDFPLMVEELGKRWHLPQTSYKGWPSCRLTHHPLTIFTQIVKNNNLAPEEIERVVIRGDAMVTATRFANQQPIGLVSSEFNHSHAIAMAALGIKRPLWYSPDVFADPKVPEFRRKVVVETESKRVEPEPGVVVPPTGRFVPPQVEVTARGQTFQGRVWHAWGDPDSRESYFTDEDLKQKFRELAWAVDPVSKKWQSQADKAIELIYDLEQVEELAKLTGILSPFAVSNASRRRRVA